MGNNNKKLIGTIIGVIFFVVLIAGATFAWLTYTANVYNGIYNAKTMNFLVYYASDSSDINNLPIFSGDVTWNSYNSDSNGNGLIGVYAAKRDVDGTLYIKLHVNDSESEELIESGSIKYAVFTYDTTLISGFDDMPFEDVADVYGVLDANDIDSNDDITLYSGPLQELSNDCIPGMSSDMYSPSSCFYEYYIYLWLDNELLTNNELGLEFKGYVHAFAIQSDPDR